ncbi:hypothetical protein BC829DRAFT_440857 [Chytridium lagenaria]|nr:hypothetical protein BC829DRAFT_440857 [Chytridium lagenaria]
MGEDYPLSSSLLSGDDLSHLRILHHRVVESVRNQCVGVVRMMKKLLERLKKVDGLDVHKMFKVGIVTSDILPETGEYLGRVLVDMLVGGGAEAKGNEEKGRNKEKGLKDEGEESRSMVSSLKSIGKMTQRRRPVVMAESKDSGIGEGKGAQDVMVPSYVNITTTNLTLTDHLVKAFVSTVPAKDATQTLHGAEVMPGSVVKGVEEFQKLGVERLRMDLWPEYRRK